MARASDDAADKWLKLGDVAGGKDHSNCHFTYKDGENCLAMDGCKESPPYVFRPRQPVLRQLQLLQEHCRQARLQGWQDRLLTSHLVGACFETLPQEKCLIGCAFYTMAHKERPVAFRS